VARPKPNVTTSERRTDYPTPSETNKNKKKKEPDNGRRDKREYRHYPGREA
jgi:hypothetical protein